jgi:microcystin degradation protein MlrC
MRDRLSAALASGRDPSGPALMFADVADNPGGGGGGNTVFLLQTLHAADAREVVMGPQTDAAMCVDAHRTGVGATLLARFNRSAGDQPFVRPFEAVATIPALSDGRRTYTGGREPRPHPCGVRRLRPA